MSSENWSTRSNCGTTPLQSIGSPRPNSEASSRSTEAGSSSFIQRPVDDTTPQHQDYDSRDFAYGHEQLGYDSTDPRNHSDQHIQPSTYDPRIQYVVDRDDPNSQPRVSPPEEHNYPSATTIAVINRYEIDEDPWNPAASATIGRRASDTFGLTDEHDSSHNGPDKMQRDLDAMEQGTRNEIYDGDAKQPGTKRRRVKSKSKSKSKFKSGSPPDPEPKLKRRKHNDEHDRGGRQRSRRQESEA